MFQALQEVLDTRQSNETLLKAAFQCQTDSVVTDFLMKINREVKVLEKAPNIWIKARKSEFSSALEVSSNAVIFPGEHLGCLDRENICIQNYEHYEQCEHLGCLKRKNIWPQIVCTQRRPTLK